MAFQNKEPKSEWIQFCNLINKWLGHGSKVWYTLPTQSCKWADRCTVYNFLGRKCLFFQAAFNQPFFTNFYTKYDVEYDLSIISIHSIRNCPWTYGFEYYIISFIDFPLQWCKVIMQTMWLPCDGPCWLFDGFLTTLWKHCDMALWRLLTALWLSYDISFTTLWWVIW